MKNLENPVDTLSSPTYSNYQVSQLDCLWAKFEFLDQGEQVMAKRLANVTDTELHILQILWDRGSTTIGEITEAIYPEKTAPQYATVQKLLERLEGKNCVSRDRSQRAHLFSATVGKEQFIGNGLQTLADQLCGGSLTPLLTNLVSSDRISSGERQSLRNLIERLDQENHE